MLRDRQRAMRVCFSIHASAKEATTSDGVSVTDLRFSIHASAKEATRIQKQFGIVKMIFNPRLREGGDDFFSHILQILKCFQSTPPRRRRPVLDNDKSGIKVFNPRLREGGDRDL